MSIESSSNKMDLHQAKSPNKHLPPDINIVVGTVLAAVAATGCSTKLDSIEKLNCDERGKYCTEFRKIESLQWQCGAIRHAKELTDPTDFTLNPDGSMSDKDILTILNKISSSDTPKATLKEWEQAGIEIKWYKTGFTMTDRDNFLVMRTNVNCSDDGCTGEVRTYDWYASPTGIKEIVEFSSREEDEPMQPTSHTAFYGDPLGHEAMWHYERKQDGKIKKSAGVTMDDGTLSPKNYRAGCVENSGENDSWDFCQEKEE